eukprot:TRINITY_DN20866_c0_g1_i1.p1 TRINITY_DN20866_c0_g1~~TRINITY_DN20866_c0_g1_i1.p1  ORF type:complete len:280 (+),score=43.62 TRINITY_DN20866_c0_g1_i1:188-1027(+)
MGAVTSAISADQGTSCCTAGGSGGLRRCRGSCGADAEIGVSPALDDHVLPETCGPGTAAERLRAQQAFTTCGPSVSSADGPGAAASCATGGGAKGGVARHASPDALVGVTPFDTVDSIAAASPFDTVEFCEAMEAVVRPDTLSLIFDGKTESEQMEQAKTLMKPFVRKLVKGTNIDVMAQSGQLKTCFVSLSRSLNALRIRLGDSCRKIRLAEAEEVIPGKHVEGLLTPLDELCTTLVLASGECITFRCTDIEDRDMLVVCLTIFSVGANQARADQDLS